MQSLKYRRSVGATAGLVGLLCAQLTTVHAATPTNAGTLELEEIVVTATKRTEKLQEVPIAVVVTSQAALQSQNLTNTADLQRLVPGLEFRHAGSPGNNGFGIRGVNTLATAFGLEQSTGVAFDGVPLARPVGGLADLVDIKQVETLKGPQGMLFGKNASAGLLNILTNSPELGKNEQNLRVSWGTLNAQQYSGTSNLAVSDNSAIRVSAWKFQHDGPIHEVNTGQDMGNQNSGGVRFKYRWKPTDNLDLNFTGEWVSHDENGTAYSIRGFYPSYFNGNNQGANVQQYELSQGTVPSDRNRVARGLNNDYYDRGHTNAYTAQADYAIGEGTLTAIASYRGISSQNSFDAFPTDNQFNTQPKNTDWVNYDQSSEEVRYASPVEDRFHYVVGLFNFRLNLHELQGFAVNGFIPGPGLINLLDVDFKEGVVNDSYAGFGEATFDITKDLHFIAGLRRTTDKVSVSMDRSGANTGPFTPGLFSTATSTKYNDLSWRTGLQYQFTPDAMVYATASRGYKGPGVGYDLATSPNVLANSDNGIVKPEIVHAYEVGLKSQWFDRRVMLNLSVYDEIFDNFQTSINKQVGNTIVVATTNARQLQTKGADLSLSWLVTSSLSLTANVGYNDAKFTDFKDAACFTGQTVAQGCVGSVQDLSGHPLAHAPKETTDLTARYEHPVSANLVGFLQANGKYKSWVFNNSSNDPLTKQGGYTVVNLSVGVNSNDDHWGVSVFGNNVFDKHYVDTFVANNSGNSILFNDLSYQDLQTFGVAVTAKF